jgi:type II secretory pathway pseudopilin PulG
MRKYLFQNYKKGISTLDLAMYIVCVAIIILAALPNASIYIDKGNRSKALGELSMLSTAISSYHKQMGVYPTNLSALTSASPYNGTPWILRLPSSDPWGTTNTGINGNGGTSAYAYSNTTAGFAVWSLGKNKTNNSGGSGTALPTSFGGDDVGIFGQ